MKLLTQAVAALGISAVSLSASAMEAGDLYGESSKPESAAYTIVLKPGARWINVERGETVKLVADGKEFAWKFNGVESKFALAKIMPADAAGGIDVYVGNDHSESMGDD